MMIKVGFNTDFGKDKFDVGLDEVDLARILAEAGIPPDAPLTELEAFQILHATGERFCAAKLAAVDPGAKEHHTLEVKRLGEKVAAQLGKIAARLDLQPDGDDSA
jgi:hypothetical protein